VEPAEAEVPAEAWPSLEAPEESDPVGDVDPAPVEPEPELVECCPPEAGVDEEAPELEPRAGLDRGSPAEPVGSRTPASGRLVGGDDPGVPASALVIGLVGGVAPEVST